MLNRKFAVLILILIFSVPGLSAQKITIPLDIFGSSTGSTSQAGQVQNSVKIKNMTTQELYIFVRGAQKSTSIMPGLEQAGIIAGIIPPHAFAFSFGWPVVAMSESGLSYMYAQASKAPCVITTKALPKIEAWKKNGHPEYAPDDPRALTQPAKPITGPTTLTFRTLNPQDVAYWSGQLMSQYSTQITEFMHTQGLYCFDVGFFGGLGDLGSWTISEDADGKLIIKKQ